MNAMHLWWENACDGQPSNIAALWPDDQAGKGVPFLWKNLFDV
jgi:hypothetical protein